jgi:hypothetical protein
LQPQIFTQDQLSLFKGLNDPQKLVAGINEIQMMQESFLLIAQKIKSVRSQDSQFASGIYDYLDFYE